MDTKRVLIIGAVGVLGIGAYLYFRPKNTKGVDASLLENPNSGISVPPKGTTLTTPEEVADTAKKIQDAKGLAKKIADLRTEKNKLSSQRPSLPLPNSIFGSIQSSAFSSLNLANANKIKKIDQDIADAEKILNSLGYTELNGNIVKIV